MNEPQPYEWCFDRSEFDQSDDPEATFSVGVYQWLPKASGKGLKKSTTIRVKGYAIASSDVYSKATELCEKLNSEKVLLDDRPSWLQNQYSVPRPSSIGPKAKGETGYIDAAKFRRVRKRVFKEILSPLGYDVSSSVAAKYDDGVTKGIIEFQSASFSSEYTINIGFHFSGLPSSSVHPKRTGIFDFACDYMLNQRIGHFMSGKDEWFNYSVSEEEAETQLISQLQVSLTAIDDLRKVLPTPQTLADRYPPAFFSTDEAWGDLASFSASFISIPYVLAHYASESNMQNLCGEYVAICKSLIAHSSGDWEDRVRDNLARIGAEQGSSAVAD